MFASGWLRLVAPWLGLLAAACAAPIATNPIGVEAPGAVLTTAQTPMAVTQTVSAPPPVEPKLEPVVPALPPPLPPPPRDQIELRAAYGAPSFVRREAESELWRYDGAGCTLFVFLYRVGGAVLIRHMETMPRNADMTADETCLATIKPRKSG